MCSRSGQRPRRPGHPCNVRLTARTTLPDRQLCARASRSADRSSASPRSRQYDGADRDNRLERSDPARPPRHRARLLLSLVQVRPGRRPAVSSAVSRPKAPEHTSSKSQRPREARRRRRRHISPTFSGDTAVVVLELVSPDGEFTSASCTRMLQYSLGLSRNPSLRVKSSKRSLLTNCPMIGLTSNGKRGLGRGFHCRELRSRLRGPCEKVSEDAWLRSTDQNI